MTEEWRPIFGFSGYEVSNLGRVRSIARIIETVGGQKRTYGSRLLRPSFAHGGYPQVNLRRGGMPYPWRVHVLVALAFIGSRPSGMEVCHNNGNPSDCRLSNLRYDTPANNAADKRRHGTARVHERHPGARLSGQDVEIIRSLLRSGAKQRAVAAAFGISRANVSAISTGRSWA